MIKEIISDLFMGLSKVKMSRFQFFTYHALITAVYYLLSKARDGVDLTLLSLSLMMIMSLMFVYPELNILAKRLRDIGINNAWLVSVLFFVVSIFSTPFFIGNELTAYIVDGLITLIIAVIPKDSVKN